MLPEVGDQEYAGVCLRSAADEWASKGGWRRGLGWRWEGGAAKESGCNATGQTLRLLGFSSEHCHLQRETWIKLESQFLHL